MQVNIASKIWNQKKANNEAAMNQKAKVPFSFFSSSLFWPKPTYDLAAARQVKTYSNLRPSRFASPLGKKVAMPIENESIFELNNDKSNTSKASSMLKPITGNETA